MAQFTARPESPQEWGGLPAEPLRRDDPTDLAPAAPETDLLGLSLGSLGVGIPVALTAEPPAPEDDAAADAG